jgi:hypothetical protein
VSAGCVSSLSEDGSSSPPFSGESGTEDDDMMLEMGLLVSFSGAADGTCPSSEKKDNPAATAQRRHAMNAFLYFSNMQYIHYITGTLPN